MALLEEPKLQDRVDQLLAFVLTLVCVGLALLAAQHVRIAFALGGELVGITRAGFRLMNTALWLVLGLGWFVYTLWVADAHQQAYTRARVGKSRGWAMPTAYAERPVMRRLWTHNLDLVVLRFAKTALIPLILLLLARLASAILQAAIL